MSDDKGQRNHPWFEPYTACAFGNPNPPTAKDKNISVKMYAPMSLFFSANDLLGGNGLFFLQVGAAGFGLILCGFLLV
jgi:hypothetical protein